MKEVEKNLLWGIERSEEENEDKTERKEISMAIERKMIPWKWRIFSLYSTPLHLLLILVFGMLLIRQIKLLFLLN